MYVLVRCAYEYVFSPLLWVCMIIVYGVSCEPNEMFLRIFSSLPTAYLLADVARTDPAVQRAEVIPGIDL